MCFIRSLCGNSCFLKLTHSISRYDCVVSIPKSEDSDSCFDRKEICVFDTTRVKITGIIEFAVVQQHNFVFPPVDFDENNKKVQNNTCYN